MFKTQLKNIDYYFKKQVKRMELVRIKHYGKYKSNSNN